MQIGKTLKELWWRETKSPTDISESLIQLQATGQYTSFDVATSGMEWNEFKTYIIYVIFL